MITQSVQDIASHSMHPLIELVHARIHEWFDSTPQTGQYQHWNENNAQQALARETPVAAAFNFHYYFATHYCKACHALQSDNIIGFGRLATWLRHNPYLTVIDVGCGDGAGSVAAVETVLRLREKDQIDPRPIKIHCIGIDPNLNGLSIYEEMMEGVAKAVAVHGIEVIYEVCPYPVSQASSCVEPLLFDCRRLWQQPSLNHSIVIEANLSDLLRSEHLKEQARLKNFGRPLKTYSPEPFGQQLASFYYQLFEGIPIDHLHILTIDTEPQKIQSVVKEMLSSIEQRLGERGHTIEHSNVHLANIEIKNPPRGYWKKRKGIDTWAIKPFIVSTCHIHNRELKLDERWRRITSRENLELAWARARQEMLRESFSDEVEIRLFEQDLESNLERLHSELDAYAIYAGYIPQTLKYATPKDLENDRPRGLTWLEEEILMIAIIQVVGANVLQQKPWSYAYRLSPENSLERGATEYLYERWADAWESFRRDIGEYAGRYHDGVVIKTDIKSYFTRILQDRLRKLVKDELNISKRIEWLVELLIGKDLADHDPGRGLVQGSVGSGFLANLYLTPLDNLFPVNDWKGRRLFRYVDDIVVVVPDASDEQTTKDLLFSTITNELHLEPNVRKTDTYRVEQYRSLIIPDEKLDRLHNSYEELIDPLWQLGEDLLIKFRDSSATPTAWWENILRYRSCLIELGLYVTAAQLSRELSRTVFSDKEFPAKLKFPSLPFFTSVDETRQWADEFRTANPVWDSDLRALKADLSGLFMENLEVLSNSSEDSHEHEIAGRRLRFSANRLGLLGLDNVHSKLTDLLCERPWLVRDQWRLVEDLARQGYSGEIWRLIYSHAGKSREMSVYMSAIALRGVRFLPRLELDEWQKLIDFMFLGSEITSTSRPK